jgi:hypothetical protein
MVSFSPNPDCKMAVCTKTAIGQLLLPSTNCHCVQDLGPGRMSLPPLIWFIMGLGLLAYIWISNLALLQAAWHSGGWSALAGLASDLGNLLLPCSLFALLIISGGLYELRKRQQELTARRPFLLCELNKP